MPTVQRFYAGAGDCVAIYERADDGSLALQRSVQVAGGVRALCMSPDNFSMHVVTADKQCITLKVDQESGNLAPSGGDPVSLPISPAYATTDKTGRFVLLASYMEPGAAAVLSVGADGSVKAVASLLDDLRSYSHFIDTDMTNRFAFVPCVAGVKAPAAKLPLPPPPLQLLLSLLPLAPPPPPPPPPPLSCYAAAARC